MATIQREVFRDATVPADPVELMRGEPLPLVERGKGGGNDQVSAQPIGVTSTAMPIFCEPGPITTPSSGETSA
jgi:hypothetical protein